MAFNTAATEKLRIASSGNIGIGITSPLDKLHVVGVDDEGAVTSTHQDNVAIFQNNFQAADSVFVTLIGGSTGYAGLNFGDKDDDDAGILRYDLYNADGGGGFQFHAEGSERMCILANGNVGIGTTSPSETLHLYSSTNVEPTLKLESGTTGNQGCLLYTSPSPRD